MKKVAEADKDRALSWPAFCGYADIIRSLVENGTSADNETALKWAVDRGEMGIVQFLKTRARGMVL